MYGQMYQVGQVDMLMAVKCMALFACRSRTKVCSMSPISVTVVEFKVQPALSSGEQRNSHTPFGLNFLQSGRTWWFLCDIDMHWSCAGWKVSRDVSRKLSHGWRRLSKKNATAATGTSNRTYIAHVKSLGLRHLLSGWSGWGFFFCRACWLVRSFQRLFCRF